MTQVSLVEQYHMGTVGRKGTADTRGTLTRHLSQAADQQRLVVAVCIRDAVTQPVLQAVLESMVPVGVCNT